MTGLGQPIAVDRDGRRLWVTVLAATPGRAVVTSADSDRWAIIELPAGVDPRQRETLARYLERAAADLFAMAPFARPDPEPAPGIQHLFLHIDDVCNLRCAHCYALREGPEHRLVGAARGSFGPAEVERMVDELAGLGLGSVTLGGGEPLLHPGLPEILEVLHRRGLGITLLTNATLVDEEWAARLADADVRVLASLHGPDAATHGKLAGRGSFAPAVAGIRRLVCHLSGQRVTVNCTLWDGNAARAPELVRLAEELGAGRIRFMPLHGFAAAVGPGRLALTHTGAELLDWVRSAARRRVEGAWKIEVAVGLSGIPGARCEEVEGAGHRVCGVGRQLIVAADGAVYPCVLLMRPEHRLGRVEDGLDALGRSARLRELEQTIAARRQAVVVCRECALHGICQAGCPALAFEVHADFDRPDPTCQAHRCYSEELFSLCAVSS